jgi:hypothetical protein
VDSCENDQGCLYDDVPCDDEHPCTTDSCDPEVGCVFTPTPDCPCESNADCLDGNPCTWDYCSWSSGTCVHWNNWWCD